MGKRLVPRYPVYVPSKGRHDRCLTARFLVDDDVPFRLVVEPQEEERYVTAFGADHVLVLPFRDRGSVVPVRNWIKKHATKEGHLRHWQLDDNMWRIRRVWRGRRIPCAAGIALRVTEDFVDRYENVAVAGLNYTMFTPMAGMVRVPFYLNVHVYSCTLVLNSLPHVWRGRYNEDTDMCLQVLADGWCTVSMNVFNVEKLWTMQMRGGNTDELYHGDGRLKMARSLERAWPRVVTTKRRFQRPQHYVKDDWKKFDTPLKLKPGVDLSELERIDEHGMKLEKVREIKGGKAELEQAVVDHNEHRKELKRGKNKGKKDSPGGPGARKKGKGRRR